ncbi:hypothetical protein EFM54_08595 [Lentilactobacillus buchneri]|uniref:hypothetical protein n=1 Tax=Lentilactobacillus buchneri TaxID=1581 RepID=UPI0021A8E95D|nr:hypothetical protein [Lentilactobacillus buchneri]MCT2899034.1 hypothetical protein [Lentilactobacillus buchneri]
MFNLHQLLEECNYWVPILTKSATALAIVIILIITVYYISGFHGGNIKKSKAVRRTLSSVDSNNENQSNNAKVLVNRIIKRSYVRRFEDGKIRIRIPTKFFWNRSSLGEVRDIIRDRLKGESFRELLENEFPNNSFGQPINHRDFYEIDSD